MVFKSTIEKYRPLVYFFKWAVGYLQISRSPMTCIKMAILSTVWNLNEKNNYWGTFDLWVKNKHSDVMTESFHLGPQNTWAPKLSKNT